MQTVRMEQKIKYMHEFMDMYTDTIHQIYRNCRISHPSTDGKTIAKISDNRIIFSRQILNEHRDTITKLLGLLPEEFHTPEGAATMIKPITELLQLGEAIGKVESYPNDDIMSILPVGMPIYSIKRCREHCVK